MNKNSLIYFYSSLGDLSLNDAYINCKNKNKDDIRL